jgi:hypothetical protein
MQEFQPTLGPDQLARRNRRNLFLLLPFMAFAMAGAGGFVACVRHELKLKQSAFASRDDIADAAIRQWLPQGAKSIEMQRRVYRPQMYVKADVSEESFRNWCQTGEFEPYELSPDYPGNGVTNGLRYRGAHDGVDAIYDRDQGKFILRQYGYWHQFPPDHHVSRRY